MTFEFRNNFESEPSLLEISWKWLFTFGNEIKMVFFKNGNELENENELSLLEMKSKWLSFYNIQIVFSIFECEFSKSTYIPNFQRFYNP